MFDIGRYLKAGLKNTLLFRNNTNISFNGPWIQVYGDTVLDRWHVSDFSTVEYTISADYDTENKEILKALVTATVDKASIVVFSRNSTLRSIIDIDATVNNSYLDLIVRSADSEDSSTLEGAKVIYSAQYYHNQNPPRL